MKRSNLVALAAVLDAVLGDPSAAPHPVRTIGSAVSFGERRVRAMFSPTPEGERFGGALLVAAVVAATAVAGSVAARNSLLEVAGAGATLALRNLLDEANGVRKALLRDDLVAARARVARIVGRDTAQLGESEIARATIETLAESLCDGVVAPVLALALGGLRGALVYKAINTMDSMIGHMEPPYRHFGTVAARADDVANFVPARVAAVAIAVAAQAVHGRGADSVRVMRTQASLHRSPNAGQTEAAMAGALGIRLGGTNSYDGVPVESVVFAPENRAAKSADILRAIRVVAIAATLCYGVAFAIAKCTERR